MGQSTIIFCVLGHFRHGNTQPNDNQQGDPSARLLLTIFEGSLLQQVYFFIKFTALSLFFFILFSFLRFALQTGGCAKGWRYRKFPQYSHPHIMEVLVDD